METEVRTLLESIRKNYGSLVPHIIIRNRLDKLEKSASWLSSQTSLTPSYVSLIVNGNRRITINSAIILSRVLDIPVWVLITSQSAHDLTREYT